MPGHVGFPEEATRRYQAEGYWTGELLGGLIDRWAAEGPGRPAVITASESWTYGELDAWTGRVAAGLFELGLRRGEHVVVQLPNRVELVVVSLALFRLGVVPVYALAAHRHHEIGDLVRRTEAVALVIPDVYQGLDYRDLARRIAPECPTLRTTVVVGDAAELVPLAGVESPAVTTWPPPQPGDVALVLLSGGTTGAPKLVPRTHDDYALQLRATAAALGFTDTGAYLAALPIAHNAALGCPGALGALRAGGRLVVASTPSPEEAFDLVASARPTATTLMPSLLQVWLEVAPILGVDLSGVVIQVGGAVLSPETARQVHETLDAHLTHWFGMAEGPLCHTRLDDPPEVAWYTQGRPLLEADEIQVVDEQGQVVPAGVVGELQYRGPTTIRRYHRTDDTGDFTPDGFLRTGDLVQITAEGNLVVEGRVKDVINRGGEKVPAGEVESHLLAHPAVRQAALVAVPDKRLGEKTCAFVVANGTGVDLPELRRFLADRGVAAYKHPDRLEVVDALPMTTVGKVDKKALQTRLAPG